MTKLANEIVEIINSRNEYMEKQAGVVNFIAKKVVKPVSRFMFGKTDLAAAKARRHLQSRDLWEKSRNAFNETTDAWLKDKHHLEELINKSVRDTKKSIAEKMQASAYFAGKQKGINQRGNAIIQKGEDLKRRKEELDKIYENFGGSSGIRGALDKANEVRDNAYRFGRDLGILGSGSVIGGAVGRLTAPEPTLQDVLNKYKDRYYR